MFFKKQKKVILLMAFVLILAMTTYGCGSNDEETDLNGENVEVTEEEAFKGEDKISLIYTIEEWDEIYDIAYSNDGSKIAVGLEKGVDIYSIEKNKIIFSNTGEKAPESKNLEFSPDDSLLLAGWHGVGIYNTEDLNEVMNLHGGRQSYISFSPDGSTIATGNMDGIVWLWKTNNGEKIKEFDPQVDEWVTALDFSYDGNFLASGFADGVIRLWNVESGELSENFKYEIEGGINDIVFSPDGKMLASVIPDLGREVHIFNLEEGNRKEILNTPESSVRSLAFSPVNNNLAIGTRDGKLYIYEINKNL